MTTQEYLTHIILPGDILLYDRDGWANTFIKFKRGEKYSHVAIASRPGYMLEARQGDVCDERPIRFDGLAAVYRHTDPIDFEKGFEWFEAEAKGQGYDWIGLLSFAFAKFQGRQNNLMFCSEFVCRFFKKLGNGLFSDDTDCDAVSPGMIPYSLKVRKLWLR